MATMKGGTMGIGDLERKPAATLPELPPLEGHCNPEPSPQPQPRTLTPTPLPRGERLKHQDQSAASNTKPQPLASAMKPGNEVATWRQSLMRTGACATSPATAK